VTGVFRRTEASLCATISRDNSVGIATGYRLEGLSSISGTSNNFLFSTASRPVLVSTQPPVQSVSEALSLGVKRLRREADLSPPSSTEVKKVGVRPPHVFIA
jgi:hypothetical protein